MAVSRLAAHLPTGKPEHSHDRVLAVSRMAGLTANEKIVGMVLAARDGAECKPGVKLLMADTALSASAVKRATRGLADKGVIARKRRGFGRGNLYTIHYGARPLGPATGPNDEATESDSHWGQPPAPRVGPATGPSLGPATGPTEPEENKKKEPEGIEGRGGGVRGGGGRQQADPPPSPPRENMNRQREMERLLGIQEELELMAAGRLQTDLPKPVLQNKLTGVKREIRKLKEAMA